MRECALFDFDGTITSKDTTRMLAAVLLGMRFTRVFGVLGYSIKYKLCNNIHEKQSLKNRILGHLLEGLSRPQVEIAMSDYRGKVEPFIRPQFMRRIEELLNRGGRVVVVTASPEEFVKACFGELSLDVIGTKFAVIDGLCTAKMLGESCFEDEKRRRVSAWLESIDEEVEITSAWSDSETDLPIMRMAQKQFWINCRPSDNSLGGLKASSEFISI